MPFRSALRTKFASCTLVYGFSRWYISDSLSVLEDEELEEDLPLDAERRLRDLLRLCFFRPSFPSCCLPRWSRSSGLSFLILAAFFSFLRSSFGSAFISLLISDL